ncbi:MULTISPECIES: CAP domain-containing protein [Arthrospira]|jgi:uncharacterized protein YkwD|uniref:SCP domain-containing protein n=1 Tax=Limnospira platensis NIES-46 TaxID=1236695 RepID=A0A5M3T6A4_LIMPL|nr:CAP domain-containing protein [Arthrospira platensis]AMW30987.1 serine protease [Arthrospira platensis YZ]KDR54756.1 serine protease [Arthrospira platensis str. Paraca]MBD2669599.1 CAP domain-containing protein [Arthrospira platensis FACHB-439]MDF2208358.1 CAP domain-containing protein [Arthrospira platensis NCB002]MDT9182786.1 CAP domain-containing protein [Limnospira sp. PMC 289.06]MDT9294916.1 CAP domain-containing protein [Arthrospira platensis PCC 7345]MDT9310441.1 CAP domain-contain
MTRNLMALASVGMGLILGYHFLPEVGFFSVVNPSNYVIASTRDIASLERQVHQQVNEYRQSRGLSPLQLDSRISNESRRHSEDMATGRVRFSHDGSKERFEAVGSQIRFRQIAENLAYNYGYADPVKQAVKGWIDSPGHHKNMIGDYSLTGIGVAINAKGEYYFTQIFVRPQ